MNSGPSQDQGIWEYQRKIPSSELRLGQFVSRLSSPWQETPFLIQGFHVGDQQELEWIRNHCDWVVVDLEKSRRNDEVNQAMDLPRTQTSQKNLLRQQPMTAQTMKASLNSYLNLSEVATRLTKQYKQLQPKDVRDSVAMVIEISATLSENLPALVWLTRIKHEDQYTAEHCLNVCILAMGLAKALNWSPRGVAEAGVAGLLHDLGKIDIDMSLLNKPGRLSEDEFAILKQHPTNGYQRLRQERDLNPNILSGILHHHERPDGLGYPDGLNADKISDIAKLVAIVDAYDAITSNRVYQQARSHHEAMSILWRMRDRQFDGAMVESFIQFLGWVTPGTLVSLSSGDLAIVVQAVEGRRLHPKVRVLMPTNVGYRLGAMWDLSTMQGTAPLHIANVLPDGYQGIRIEEFAETLMQA